MNLKNFQNFQIIFLKDNKAGHYESFDFTLKVAKNRLVFVSKNVCLENFFSQRKKVHEFFTL